MSEISVIIPTYNRAAQLHACLKALSLQTQAATDFDVIVIDDGSIDGTSEMLAEIEIPFVPRDPSGKGRSVCRAQ
jgi:glycosyltransferase involved in cell wall biosynthesis